MVRIYLSLGDIGESKVLLTLKGYIPVTASFHFQTIQIIPCPQKCTISMEAAEEKVDILAI